LRMPDNSSANEVAAAPRRSSTTAIGVAAQTRSAAATELYLSLVEQLELRRQRLKWPSWLLDDRAGLEDGYWMKALHANTPSGRQAGWRIIQYVVDALYPRGARIKVIPCRKRKRSAAGVNGGNGHSIETSQDVPPKLVRDWLRVRMSTIGQKGGKARQRAMTKQERSALAREAARQRWHPPQVTEVIPAQRARRKGNGARRAG
jgi:hypothetical protein